jgi:hypothetical protein
LLDIVRAGRTTEATSLPPDLASIAAAYAQRPPYRSSRRR